MKYGLTEKDYNFIKNTLFSVLNKSETVWCFGSRVKGTYQRYSDLDLMIESQEDCMEKIAILNDLFENSDLEIKIDLVDLRNFSKSYLQDFEDTKVKF